MNGRGNKEKHLFFVLHQKYLRVNQAVYVKQGKGFENLCFFERIGR